MIRSAIALNQVDPGFDPNGRAHASTSATCAREANDEFTAKVATIKQRLAAVPGAKAVSMASQLPLDTRASNARWGPEAARNDMSKYRQGQIHFVPPGYFGLMRARIIDGRDFDASDEVPGTADGHHRRAGREARVRQ